MSAAEKWVPITAAEYHALPGREGGGMFGCVFKYDGEQIVGRRSFDEYATGPIVWEYAAKADAILSLTGMGYKKEEGPCSPA